MSTMQSQFLDLTARHDRYGEIDPLTTLSNSAAGKIVFIAGASRGIGQATAVAFAQAGAEAVFITADALKETQILIQAANPNTRCAYGLCEFTQADHSEDGIKCMVIHPGGVATELGRNTPSDMLEYLVDTPDLAACFAVWVCSGASDWAKGRYLSATWDVTELQAMKDEILQHDLLVNRLRAKI